LENENAKENQVDKLFTVHLFYLAPMFAIYLSAQNVLLNRILRALNITPTDETPRKNS